MSDNMKVLTRDDILNKKDYVVEEVFVAEWGGTVRLRSLTGEGRDVYTKKCSDQAKIVRDSKGNVDIGQSSADTTGLKALLLSLTIVDANDVPMFIGKEGEKALNGKSATAIETLFDISQRMNKLRDDDIKEEVGNSDASPKASSGSGSLVT